MGKDPWLTIIGLGEDGLEGLSPASREALAGAEIVMGAARHLALLPDLPGDRREWPVPFADGLPILFDLRGRKVVVLASGDPFWFGAGTVFARHLDPGEWRAIGVPSVFSQVAAQLGWGLETSHCIGLHAAPFTRLRPILAPKARIITTLRDGAAVQGLASYLTDAGFGTSALHICEAMGGPRQRVRHVTAKDYALNDAQHPVAVAIEVAGNGEVLPHASGRGDDWFAHDGQITKRPVRALALSALAPRPGEMLWDIGSGSGSIAIEWLLSAPTCQAIGFEANPERASRARDNAARLGVERLQIIETRAPAGLEAAPKPDVVFIGGGASQDLLESLWRILPVGTRLVAHAVTLESEALLALWQGQKGGTLLRIELAEAKPLGTRTGWKSAYPVVQWSVVL